MNAFTLGPVMLSMDRVTALGGIVAFIVAATFAARRSDETLVRWSSSGLLVGLLVARLMHVAIHWESFSSDPGRAFYVWQGGFFWPAGVAAALALLLYQVSQTRDRLAGAASIATGLFIWHAASILTSGVEPVPLPSTPLQTLAGEAITLQELSGRPMVVNLWATWCPPCRREMPMMADVAATSEGVTFVFANQGEDAPRIRNYLSQEQLLLPNVLMDGLGELGRAYRAPGLPATLFIAADGSLSNIHIGEISREAMLEKMRSTGNSGARQ